MTFHHHRVFVELKVYIICLYDLCVKLTSKIYIIIIIQPYISYSMSEFQLKILLNILLVIEFQMLC